MASEWRKIPLTLAELCIDTTLRCGQSFRWRKFGDEWICALRGRIVSLKQDSTHLHYNAVWPAQSLPSTSRSADVDDTETLLRHYFSLNLDLPALYRQWSKADPNFEKKAPGFEGVRMLSQDGWEALICFICSSNNNISRISQMVHKLCHNYGPLVGHVHSNPVHDFPSPEALTGPKIEAHLRELGFGYRAKYIADTARTVALKRPSNWLDKLHNPEYPGFPTSAESDRADSAATMRSDITYREAHNQLIQLTGVGPKVADCVCLMGLGWGEAVPVDTHVWQIAQRDYKFGKFRTKTFNKTMYDAVGDLFRGLWGKHAGWAHSVLFTADLKNFAEQGAKSAKGGAVKAVKVEEVGEEVKEEPQHEVKNEAKYNGGTRASKKRRITKTHAVEVKQEVLDEVPSEDLNTKFGVSSQTVKTEVVEDFTTSSPSPVMKPIVKRRTRTSMAASYG